MDDSAKSNIGTVVSIISTSVAVLGLAISYAVNREAIDEFLCKSEFLRLNCSATAKLDFLSVEGWAWRDPLDRFDVWDWGETNESRARLSESESDWGIPGRSKAAPLRC